MRVETNEDLNCSKIENDKLDSDEQNNDDNKKVDDDHKPIDDQANNNELDENGVGKKITFSYSRDELIQLSKLSFSRIRPACLDNAFNNDDGLWNPEKWILRKSDKDNQNIGRNSANSGRETDKDITRNKQSRDKSQDLLLIPHRNHFNTGCHVSKNESKSQNQIVHEKKDNYTNKTFSNVNRSKPKIGTGRIDDNIRSNDWSDRYRDYDRSRNMRNDEKNGFQRNRPSGRYSDSDMDLPPRNRRDSFKNSHHHHFREEAEPEWFTGGPKSQNETIELKGFEDQDGERRTDEMSFSGKQVVECESKDGENGEGSENLINQTSRSQENDQDFDLNEIFKINWHLDETRPESEDIGASRFVKWFSNTARSNSPLDLFNESSMSSIDESKKLFESSADSGASLISPKQHEQKSADIFSLLKKARININDVITNQPVVNAQLDPSKMKSLSEIEENLIQTKNCNPNGRSIADSIRNEAFIDCGYSFNDSGPICNNQDQYGSRHDKIQNIFGNMQHNKEEYKKPEPPPFAPTQVIRTLVNQKQMDKVMKSDEIPTSQSSSKFNDYKMEHNFSLNEGLPRPIIKSNPNLNRNIYQQNDLESIVKLIETQNRNQKQQKMITETALNIQRNLNNVSPLPFMNPGMPTTNPNILNMKMSMMPHYPVQSTFNPQIFANNQLHYQLRQQYPFITDHNNSPMYLPNNMQQYMKASNIGNPLANCQNIDYRVNRANSAILSDNSGLVDNCIKINDLQNQTKLMNINSDALIGENFQQGDNLMKWFGNELLNQNLPQMPPPSSMPNAMRLEELERH